MSVEGSSKVRAGSSITDELREWTRNHTVNCSDNRIALVAIADRIDERHAKARDKAYDEGVCDGIDADKEARGYVKLPVDANGEIIHIGDNMTNGVDLPAKVQHMVLGEHGWKLASVFIGDRMTVLPTDLRHVKPDSWERIIEDAISECGWEQPKEYEIDFEESKEVRNRFVAELVERCKRLAGE